jgi:hypothetical protein
MVLLLGLPGWGDHDLYTEHGLKNPGIFFVGLHGRPPSSDTSGVDGQLKKFKVFLVLFLLTFRPGISAHL